MDHFTERVSIPDAVEPFAPVPADSNVHPDGVLMVALYGLQPTYNSITSPVVVLAGMIGAKEVEPATQAPASRRAIAMISLQ